MANKRISELTSAAADRAHEYPVNAGGGLTRKVTVTSLLGLIGDATGLTKLKIAQGTITDPALGIEHTVTWNDASDTFVAQRLNVTSTASAADSLLLDLQVGGVSKFYVRKDGRVTVTGAADFSLRNSSGNCLVDVQDGQVLSLVNNGVINVTLSGGAGGVGQAVTFGPSLDAVILREAADIIALRRDTNPQAFRVYNTFTDPSNYERIALKWDASDAYLSVEDAGSGSPRNLFILAGENKEILLADQVNGCLAVQPAQARVYPPNDNSVVLGISETNRFKILHLSNYIEMNEMTAPGTPPTGFGRMYLVDNGGKTEVLFKFDDGSTAQVCIQP